MNTRPTPIELIQYSPGLCMSPDQVWMIHCPALYRAPSVTDDITPFEITIVDDDGTERIVKHRYSLRIKNMELCEPFEYPITRYYMTRATALAGMNRARHEVRDRTLPEEHQWMFGEVE